MPEENEEDEDDPGGGGETPTVTCTDVEHSPVTTMVPVWVVPGTCGETETQSSCDFETEICTGIRVYVCPGRWVDQEVVLREGYTERVCTTN